MLGGSKALAWGLAMVPYRLCILVEITFTHRERSGSVVECLTRDREAAGLSLIGVTHCVVVLEQEHLS